MKVFFAALLACLFCCSSVSVPQSDFSLLLMRAQNHLYDLQPEYANAELQEFLRHFPGPYSKDQREALDEYLKVQEEYYGTGSRAYYAVSTPGRGVNAVPILQKRGKGKRTDYAFVYQTASGEQLGDESYTAAAPFKSHGYARVKRAGRAYLLDASGREYPVAYALKDLTEKHEALDLSTAINRVVPTSIAGFENLEVFITARSFSGFDAPCSIPPELADLPRLRTLSVEDCICAELLLALNRMENLEYLYLDSRNELGMEHSLGNLRKLKSLTFQQDQLLPVWREWIADLTMLEELKARARAVREVPESIGRLTKLKYVRITTDTLLSLPTSFAELKELRYLGLHGEIASPPEVIFALSELRWLSIGGQWSDFTESTKVERSFAGFPKLLGLRLNSLTNDRLPPGVDELTELESFQLGTSSGIADLPAGFAALQNLHTLKINNCGLITIPKVLSELPRLRHLSASGNQISIAEANTVGTLAALRRLDLIGNKQNLLQPIFSAAPGLRSLRIWNNRLLHADQENVTAPELRKLDIGGARMEAFPYELVKLPRLNSLSLRNCRLDLKGVDWGSSKNLSSLYLGGNKLDTLSAAILQLPRLTDLTVSETGLTHIDDAFTPNLVSFYLGSNKKLKQLPASFGRLKYLRNLDLYETGVDSLPASVRGMTSVRKLMLNSHHIRHLPEDFGELSSLEVLSIQGSEITSLPASFGRLTNLRALNMMSLPLEKLPPGFSKLKNLGVLLLSGCRLTQLPVDIAGLENLTKLSMEDNKLTEVPADLGKLKSLTELSLYRNNISSTEEWFPALTSLRSFNIGNNQITDVPELSVLHTIPYYTLADNQIIRLDSSLCQYWTAKRPHNIDYGLLRGNPLVEVPNCLLENFTGSDIEKLIIGAARKEYFSSALFYSKKYRDRLNAVEVNKVVQYVSGAKARTKDPASGQALFEFWGVD